MKGKNLFITALVMTLAGIILIITCSTLASVKIVIAGGILFIVAGLANMLFFLKARDKDGRSRFGAFGSAVGWVASAAAIVLGLCMLIFQQTFIPLVSFMFAILLAFAAVFQFCLLLFGSRPVKLAPWLYIVPLLLFGAAVFIYLQRPGETAADRTIMLVTGIALAVFGVFSIIEGCMIAYEHRRMTRAAQTPAPARKDDTPAHDASPVAADDDSDEGDVV